MQLYLDDVKAAFDMFIFQIWPAQICHILTGAFQNPFSVFYKLNKSTYVFQLFAACQLIQTRDVNDIR